MNDGRSFTARRVVAVQHGQPIFALSASFQRYEDGLDHQAPMPAAHDPETLPTAEQRLPAYGLPPAVVERMLAARAAVDLRCVDDPPCGRYGRASYAYPGDGRSGVAGLCDRASPQSARSEALCPATRSQRARAMIAQHLPVKYTCGPVIRATGRRSEPRFYASSACSSRYAVIGS